MTGRRWVVAALVGLMVAATGGGVWFTWLLRATPLPSGMDAPRGMSFIGWLLFAAIGVVLTWRRPANIVGWLLLGTGLLWQLHGLAGAYRAAALLEHPTWPAADAAAWIWEWAWAPGILAVFLVPLLFPHGRLPSPRWRWVPPLLAMGTVATIGAVALRPGSLPSTPMTINPLGLTGGGDVLDLVELVGTLLFMVAGIAALVAPLVRYRRAEDIERHQLKWFATAVGIALLAWITASVLQEAGADPVLLADIRLLPLVLLPLAIAVAILQYRLYDIDVVLHRGFVYGALALFIGAVYVIVVVGVGQLTGARTGDVPLALGATVITAVAFAPLRAHLQGLADRLVYGHRTNPYDVLASVTSRMTSVTTGRGVLHEIARTAAEAVGAQSSEVWLRTDTELRRAATWPDSQPADPNIPGVVAVPTDGDETVPLPGLDQTYPVWRHGRLLGVLGIALARGERLRPSEDALLTDLAATAWLVLDNVGLIDELRASRQRLVTAQDAERERIERDLHDGAQQRLLELALTLRLARDQVAGGRTAGSVATLDGAQDMLRAALAELRELARGIHPPILTSRGLDAALESLAERAPLRVRVEGGTPRLAPLIESTAYFVASEALANVIKHAHASRVTVRTTLADGQLRLEVTDDGIGGADPTSSGLQGLADRVAAVDGHLRVASPPGGGTSVEVELPCG